MVWFLKCACWHTNSFFIYSEYLYLKQFQKCLIQLKQISGIFTWVNSLPNCSLLSFANAYPAVSLSILQNILHQVGIAEIVKAYDSIHDNLTFSWLFAGEVMSIENLQRSAHVHYC